MKQIKVIIEILKGNKNNKYEYDESTGELKVDFVFENLTWPYNYGFIPETRGGDGDTLDAVVYSTEPLKQGQGVLCKIFGAMQMLDRGQRDDKILMTPIGDTLANKYNDIDDFPEAERQKFIDFNLEIARQKKKAIKITGFIGKKETLQIIKSPSI